MERINIKQLQNWYAANFQNKLHGRRIVFEDIDSILKKIKKTLFTKNIEGFSENNIPIYKLKIGTGPKKIMIWSQMHGDESTGSKALFDLFQFFENPKKLSREKDIILNSCTLIFIPMLNPDGSKMFKRLNANDIDLNRDATNLFAKESRLLRKILDEFKPDFCFNLHDQRTIYNVEGTKKPASISFLAPSEDFERNLTSRRKKSMSVIVSMNSLLSLIIPNHIGRYTDEFCPTATGDNFQKLGHNTILIEAGHYYNDYEREEVRKFNFFALIQGIFFISNENKYMNYKPYFNIPNNDKKFFDIIHWNVLESEKNIVDIAYQYNYVIKNNKLHLELSEAKRGNLKGFIGHKEIDFKKTTPK